jgi:hypothetical protein
MLNFRAAGRGHVRTVAFRYTQAMIHLIPLRAHLDVQNLNTDRGERPDQRFEDSTLRGKPKLDLR